MRIVYNAECGVLGPTSAWMSVEITIDGNSTNPASGTSFAMCTSNNNTSAHQWTGTVRQAYLTVPTKGIHTLQVQGAGLNGATNWWLGDTSLVIDH